mmetsp:Transcript_10486/g.31486  ORF Transcript_10486/g.31486 Transcript_10486/m.31486 type:complete len:331 (-) Transcript_10486:556-1548(-)
MHANESVPVAVRPVRAEAGSRLCEAALLRGRFFRHRSSSSVRSWQRRGRRSSGHVYRQGSVPPGQRTTKAVYRRRGGTARSHSSRACYERAAPSARCVSSLSVCMPSAWPYLWRPHLPADTPRRSSFFPPRCGCVDGPTPMPHSLPAQLASPRSTRRSIPSQLARHTNAILPRPHTCQAGRTPAATSSAEQRCLCPIYRMVALVDLPPAQKNPTAVAARARVHMLGRRLGLTTVAAALAAMLGTELAQVWTAAMLWGARHHAAPPPPLLREWGRCCMRAAQAQWRLPRHRQPSAARWVPHRRPLTATAPRFPSRMRWRGWHRRPSVSTEF